MTDADLLTKLAAMLGKEARGVWPEWSVMECPRGHATERTDRAYPNFCRGCGMNYRDAECERCIGLSPPDLSLPENLHHLCAVIKQVGDLCILELCADSWDCNLYLNNRSDSEGEGEALNRDTPSAALYAALLEAVKAGGQG